MTGWSIALTQLALSAAPAFALLPFAAPPLAAQRVPPPPDAIAALSGGDPMRALSLARASGDGCAVNPATPDACADIWLLIVEAAMAADQPAEAELAARRLLAVIPADRQEASGAQLLLGMLLQARGRHAEAEPLLRAALNIALRIEGPNGAGVGMITGRLGISLIAFRREVEAEAMLRRAVAILSARSDVPPELLVGVMIEHGMALGMLDRHTEAEAVLRRALVLAGGGGDAAKTLPSAMMALGMGLMGQERYREAEPALRQAVALHERHYGKLHFETAKALLAYGMLLRDVGRHADAEVMLRRAIIPHALSGDWSTMEAVTTAVALGELVAYRNPQEARLFFSRAALGARLRVASYRDHGIAAQAELSNFSMIFFGQVQLAWRAAQERK